MLLTKENKILNGLNQIGEVGLFLRELFRIGIKQPCSSKMIFEQIWSVTTQSLATTAFAGFFVVIVIYRGP